MAKVTKPCHLKRLRVIVVMGLRFWITATFAGRALELSRRYGVSGLLAAFFLEWVLLVRRIPRVITGPAFALTAYEQSSIPLSFVNAAIRSALALFAVRAASDYGAALAARVIFAFAGVMTMHKTQLCASVSNR